MADLCKNVICDSHIWESQALAFFFKGDSAVLDCHKSLCNSHNDDSNNPHEVRTLKRCLGWGEFERGGVGFRHSSPLPSRKKATNDFKITAESSRSKNTESNAESLKDSINFTESSDSKNSIDCHDFNKLKSRNDVSTDSTMQNLPMTKKHIASNKAAFMVIISEAHNAA